MDRRLKSTAERKTQINTVTHMSQFPHEPETQVEMHSHLCKPLPRIIWPIITL